MKPSPRLKQYLHEVAQKLRQHECERARGNLAVLESIEHTTDASLLRKWGWISTFVGAIFAFFVMPLAITIFQPFVSGPIDNMLWAVAKVSMAMALLMFGASIYFTLVLSE